jgi:hypothetical protein
LILRKKQHLVGGGLLTSEILGFYWALGQEDDTRGKSSLRHCLEEKNIWLISQLQKTWKLHQPKETLEVYDAEISSLCVTHFQLMARQLLGWNALQWMRPD